MLNNKKKIIAYLCKITENQHIMNVAIKYRENLIRGSPYMTSQTQMVWDQGFSDGFSNEMRDNGKRG